MSPTDTADHPHSSSPQPASPPMAAATVSSYASVCVRQPTWNPWTGFKQWYWPTSEQAAHEAQARLLRRIPFFTAGAPRASATAGLQGSEETMPRTVARVELVELDKHRA